jgi:hypothetical protein
MHSKTLSGPIFASGFDESAGYSARVMKCPGHSLIRRVK